MSTLENQPPPASPEGAQQRPAAALPHGRDQFIPLRKADLAETLCATPQLPDGGAAAFVRFCRLLHALVQSQLQARFEEVKQAYAPFDPDSDTRAGHQLPEESLVPLRGRFFDAFAWLLSRGNFVRLAEEDINQALADRTHWGLHLKVDFELFDRLELYYRGDMIGRRYRRRLRNRFRSEEVEVPIYQRLVVVFRLRPGRRLSKILDTRDIYIKLFKDIPKLDLDMLLPGTQVRMSLLDRLRFMLPTLSGIGIAIYKIVWVTTIALGSSLAFLGLVGGTLGYGVRSLYGYLNTKQKYQLNLTQSLYYQNIDNNAGVLHRLFDEAGEQENREVMLAYFFLWHQAPPEGLSAEELDRRVEAWLLGEVEQDDRFRNRRCARQAPAAADCPMRRRALAGPADRRGDRGSGQMLGRAARHLGLTTSYLRATS